MPRKVHGEDTISGGVAIRQQARMLIQSFWLGCSLPEGGESFPTQLLFG